MAHYGHFFVFDLFTMGGLSKTSLIFIVIRSPVQ